MMAAPVAAPVAAQGWAVEDLVRAEVLPGWRTERGTHMAALHLTLAEGWKTYWRAPGDSGVPPRFDWAGSDNLAAVRVHWPQPRVFDTSGVRTIGFEHELVLPLEFTLHAQGDGATIAARVDLGVCEAVCVPVTLTIDAVLPPGAAARDPRITAALDSRPTPAADAGLRGAECALAPIDDGMRLTATLTLPPLGGQEVAVVEVSDAAVWVSEAVTERRGERLHTQVDLVSLDGGALALDRSDLRITVLGAGRAVEMWGCPAR
ncbi:hypothetical protein CCR87_10875 [Rhodobaculum claviforme]|uniref:Thiol:disulfide interchange protein DsbD N-terminal domain-containing protein n=2 Tax=Rhodobaculum claviforme TaxID=1549854 RepID=A0A934WI45_9RHOB|nr:hypothetical protein [Rhodobaculum claviforme]